MGSNEGMQGIYETAAVEHNFKKYFSVQREINKK